ncbi:MAG: XRE family transcriptional regulator [Methylovirgula sp.]
MTQSMRSPIRPITSDEDHTRAFAAAEKLWDAPEDSIESQEFDALATLIDAYERKRWPVAASDPIEIIEYAVAELGRSQAGLSEIVGSRARASELLSRKRGLDNRDDRQDRQGLGNPSPVTSGAVPAQEECAASRSQHSWEKDCRAKSADA